ncbi:hypothetical protein T552_02129 [Pneumocystis carinii B80]|uniref:Translation machinery-associated protein 16 n=1 Tax=Pneumocystis carinii (strain B80) TaxID=1408658 RepID=A0A0W4ZH46_PNEC8|nr:hypothetical protein T552_02129 [Pneumocystis carinii B80]KTW27689.1 hypothetical protein T552_02129 [Pneumocystis carinii B80]
MPKVLNLRKIWKKKGANLAHPRSRKAKQIQKSINREDRIKKERKIREKRRDIQISRCIYFKSIVELENITKLSLKELNKLIERYIHRNDSKIQESSCSDLHPHHSSKKESFKRVFYDEQNEYKNGFNVPDITDEENVLALKKWTGNYNDLHTLKFIRVKKEDS